jgi:hypothetical protein
MLAIGSYGGNVGLFDGNGRVIDVVKKPQKNGVTQIKWHQQKLYIGGRKSKEILCYDVRQLSAGPLVTFARTVTTHQHLNFDIRSNMLVSGDTETPLGLLNVYNLDNGERMADLPLHQDVIGAASFHPVLPILATATGQRRNGLTNEEEEEENVAALWRCPSKFVFE